MKKKEELTKLMPKEGFIKISDYSPKSLPSPQKTALIRKGNEFYNKGDYETAKRIFITAGYTDGISRIGDYYYNNNMLYEAFRMYWIAPDKHKVDSLIEKMIGVIRKWLHT